MVIAIKYFDAFAGIGGFRSGLEQAGDFECIGSCEIDKYAAAAYKALYDTEGEDFYSDITKIDTGNLRDFDLLVGGFPCQPFSAAGKRLSFADERGNLFFELARILEAKRPRYFIFENVPYVQLYIINVLKEKSCRSLISDDSGKLKE